MSQRIRVGLAQINDTCAESYMPYSIACLQAYAQRHLPPQAVDFMPLVYKRAAMSQIVARLSGADLVGFSIYIWNAQISLEVARRLKRQEPDCTIVFGGPHVPNDAEQFLTNHEFIDLVVHGEGEGVFSNVLMALPEHDWSGVDGISYVTDKGEIARTKSAERLRDLNQIPSPFLSGVFDDIMRSHPEEEWIALWETNRGCPFQCTFCDWGSATASKVNAFDLDRLKQEIDWFSSRKVKTIMACDANFGIMKRDLEIARYVCDAHAQTGYPRAFLVQNTKNKTERAYSVQTILAEAKLGGRIGLAMQSLDSVTLTNIKRDNISLDTYFELGRRFATDDLETDTDIILGLPGETYDSFTRGIETLMGQNNRVRFTNLTILPNAKMGDPEYRKCYGMTTSRSPLVNLHTTMDHLNDGVVEYQDLVTSTASLPAADWRSARVFSWMAAFLFFDKIFMLPMIITKEVAGISFRGVVEAFVNAPEEYEVVFEIRSFFEREASAIQQGGPEYVYSQDWLGIWWLANEYIFIKLTVEDKLSRFYEEASRLLSRHVFGKSAEQKTPLAEAIAESIALNSFLISQPFVALDVQFHARYNITAFLDGLKKGSPVELVAQNSEVKVLRKASPYSNLQDWCREVVWAGKRLYQRHSVVSASRSVMTRSRNSSALPDENCSR